MTLPAAATVREVGLRDGLQSLGAMVPTEGKVALAAALATSGISRVEVTSFMRPDVIPQTADAAELMAAIDRDAPVAWEALVPNVRGAQRAVDAEADALVLVVAASETFNERNVGMSIESSLRAFSEVARLAAESHVPAVAVVATAFGCPFEGEVPSERPLVIAAELAGAGAVEVFFGDTVGVANPVQVEAFAHEARDRFPTLPLGLHLHDTRGMGLANLVAGLRAGINTFDASVGGLGGCPFAPVASGNISTEDAVHMLEAMGVRTGIELGALVEAARLAERLVGFTLPGQVMKAGPAALLRA